MSGGSFLISWKEYKFVKPNIDQKEFTKIKELLILEPTYKIMPKKGIVDFCKEFKYYLMACCLSLIILFFNSLIETSVNTFMDALLAFLFLGLIFWLIGGTLRSMYNYIGYILEYNRHSKNLQRVINESDNYEIFTLYKKNTW
jgi:predicted membrane protein